MLLNIRAFLFIYLYLFGVQAVPFGPLLVRALGYPPPPPHQKKKKHEYKLSYMKLSHKACVESELGKTDIYIYIYIRKKEFKTNDFYKKGRSNPNRKFTPKASGTCYKCGRKGHFQKECKTKAKTLINTLISDQTSKQESWLV